MRLGFTRAGCAAFPKNQWPRTPYCVSLTVAGQWRLYTAFPFTSGPLVIVLKYQFAAASRAESSEDRDKKSIPAPARAWRLELEIWKQGLEQIRLGSFQEFKAAELQGYSHEIGLVLDANHAPQALHIPSFFSSRPRQL